MRILIYTKDENMTENIFKEKNSSIFKFLNIDIVNDIEEAAYLLDIRKYNEVFIDFEEKKYKKYFNLLKVLNTSNLEFFCKLTIFVENENSNVLNIFKKHEQSVYKNINPIYSPKNNYINFISKEIQETFYKIPEIIEKYEIDLKTQTVNLFINNNKFSITIDSKRDFKVLLFFIQHYGEILNVETIVSATFKDPEYRSTSTIESAISSIRKLFENLIGDHINPIVAHKKIGYRFAL